MVILLKIILGILSTACIVFGRLVFREYKLFNKDIETKNTSLGERILINGMILVIGFVLVSILLFSITSIFSTITITPPF